MESVKPNTGTKTRFALTVSRIVGILAFLALVAAWISEFTGSKLFGLSTQHFFNDAIVFSLWSIAGLLDVYLHSKRLG